MVCRSILIDGKAMIVCSRERPRRCKCGRPAQFLCDAPNPKRSSGTCDKPVCNRCVIDLGDEKHHCRSHPQGTLEGLWPEEAQP